MKKEKKNVVYVRVSGGVVRSIQAEELLPENVSIVVIDHDDYSEGGKNCSKIDEVIDKIATKYYF